MALKDYIRLYKRLRPEVRRVDAIRWAISTRRDLRRTMPLRLNEMTIYVRSATPDAGVCMSCTRGEFAALFAEVPTLKHNLILDAGGYIGTAAIMFARNYPDARILTLEPSGENFQILERNVAPYTNIIPVKKALGGKPRSVKLLDRGTGEWGFTIVEKPRDRPSKILEEVDTITITDIMSEYQCEGIDIVKLDIEGGEYDLFTGDTSWVRRTGAICAELHERIVEGCTEAFFESTSGRRNIPMDGEKILSILASDPNV